MHLMPQNKQKGTKQWLKTVKKIIKFQPSLQVQFQIFSLFLFLDEREKRYYKVRHGGLKCNTLKHTRLFIYIAPY